MAKLLIVEQATEWHASYRAWLHGHDVEIVPQMPAKASAFLREHQASLVLVGMNERVWKSRIKIETQVGDTPVVFIDDVRCGLDLRRRKLQAKRRGAKGFIPRNAGGEHFREQVHLALYRHVVKGKQINATPKGDARILAVAAPRNAAMASMCDRALPEDGSFANDRRDPLRRLAAEAHAVRLLDHPDLLIIADACGGIAALNALLDRHGVRADPESLRFVHDALLEWARLPETLRFLKVIDLFPLGEHHGPIALTLHDIALRVAYGPNVRERDTSPDTPAS